MARGFILGLLLYAGLALIGIAVGLVSA